MVHPMSRAPPACAEAMRSGSDFTECFLITLLIILVPRPIMRICDSFSFFAPRGIMPENITLATRPAGRLGSAS